MVWLVALTGFFVAGQTPASGEEALSPGRGDAYAQGVRMDPRAGGLSFGITYGMALAGHQNSLAIGEARSVDLGVIGTVLAAEPCDGGDPTLAREDQPQPLVVRNTDEGSQDGRSDAENGVARSARADGAPFAESSAVSAAINVPGVVDVGAATTTTSSGLVDGERIARASSHVPRVSIGGGALVLRGLRWEASWKSGPTEEVTGKFTVEGIEVGGQPVDIPAGDAVTALEELGMVLEPLGIVIEAPRVRNESGISFVDPLRIAIEPSELRDGISGPLLSALQPVREELVDALIEFDCSNGTYVTVVDIIVGSITGAGSFSLELGGVTASSAEINRSSFLSTPGSGGFVPTPGPSVSSGGGFLPPVSGGADVASAPSSLSPSGTETTTVVTTPASTGGEEIAAPELEPLSGDRGGALAAVGAVGLALLGLLAEIDRRKMRRAQRSVPMEVLA